jgi:hypothetical protein
MPEDFLSDTPWEVLICSVQSQNGGARLLAEIFSKKTIINKTLRQLLNTTRIHYKHHIVDAVLGNKHSLLWESYETYKYKMQSYSLLKQVVHIVTTEL